LNHTHAIPNILIFTHHTNLLDDAAVKRLLHTIATDNNATLAGAARQDTIEVHALADNVRNIIRLHPDATVRFLTDQDCVASIQAAMGTDTELVNFFLHEKQGMYKADLCRGAALWETGGIYLDVDLGVRLRLWDVLLEDTEFATVRVHLQSQHPGAFFQAFMAVTPQHAIVARYLELFLDYYQGRLPAHAVNGPLGVMLLRRAFDEVTTTADAVDPTTQRNTTAAAAAVDDDTVEIWQELLYLPQFQKTILSHVPPPVWGKRRACKFVVVANLQEPFLVPFYSRIANSRMCPAQPRGDMGNYAKATDTVEEHGDGKAADETADA
jgi:mannosyltransferase OCH1-like enzyme